MRCSGGALPPGLLLLATATVLWRTRLLHDATAAGLALGAALASLGALIYVRGTPAPDAATARRAGLLPLGCVALLVFALADGLIHRATAEQQNLLLGRTLLIAALSIGCVLIGRWKRRGAATLVGLAGMGALAVKVFTWDLAELDGGRSVAAVAAAGAAALCCAACARSAAHETQPNERAREGPPGS